MRNCLLLLLGLSLFLPAQGCSKAKEENAELAAELPDWLDEDDAAPRKGRSRKASSSDVDDEYDSAAENDRPESERPGKLELRLNPGDRFPLSKVVDVELAQASLTGKPEISRRRLELMLMIEVVDQRDSRTQLKVNYERVKYSRDVAGDRLEYDSRNPPTEVPVAVRMYHDMVQDGFSFWLNDRNQIVESEDFKGFLTRCLRNVPEEQRQQALREAESHGENGITDFIDNSIALLPFGYHRAGDSWDKTRHVTRPVPMVLHNTYRLEELNDEVALISVTGDVGSSTTSGHSRENSDVKVTVQGGHSRGECTVFRDTGLPRSSRVETLVDMLVQASSLEFRQQQRTLTTIESYPVARQSRPEVIGASYEEPEDSPPTRQKRRTSFRD